LYFGADGKPCLRNDGNAGWIAAFDERGNRTSWTFIGIDGKPCLIAYGYAGWKSTFDAQGRETGQLTFGVDGKPCLSENGYAEVRSVYDPRGNEILRTFFGTDGKPCLNKNGFASCKLTFNERDFVTNRSYFDERGKPVVSVAVEIQEVVPKGKAGALGLHVGDIIVRYDGKHYTDFAKLVIAIKAPGNKPRELVVHRDGKEISYQVMPGLLGVQLGTLYGPAAPISK
jgi:hypothetical protein